MVNVTDKVFVGSDLLWMGLVDNDLVFNVIYRSGLENLTYGKRFKMPRFIINREYRLFPGHKRSVIQMLTVGDKEIRARVSLVPSSRARYNSIEIDMDDLLLKGASAKGKRISNRVVRRVSNITGKPRKKTPIMPSLPGLTIKKKEKK